MANVWGNAPANNSLVAFISDDSVAANYPVAPGFTVALINANDPEHSKLFLKSAQANGMPNQTRVFELREVTPQGQGGAVSRQEFDGLTQRLAAMQKMLEDMAKGGKAQ